MNENKRVIATLLCVVMVVLTIFAGKYSTLEETVEVYDNDSLVVWYTDDSLTDYLNAMAVDYHEKFGVRVIPKLRAGDDYVESIYHASIDETGAPDLYIVGSDSLEKAYMCGVASMIEDPRSVVSDVNFPKSALDATMYHNQRVAYPYYFETTALLYNESYLREMATNKVTAELAKTPDEEDEEAEDLSGIDPEILIEERINQCIPTTFEGLLTIADEYDAPEGVETIFKWDVRDIFYNYFFVGSYINLGGEFGDDSNIIDVYNMDSVKALQVFQDMNQFFSFESADVTYSQVVDEFIEGKLIFATVTSDALKAIEEAKAAGEFSYEYGLSTIPDLNDEMSTRSLAVTNVLAVNGYSDKRDQANALAQFLSISQAGSLYERTGKLPTKLGAIPDDSPAYTFVNEYQFSVPMPKLMATSNSWLLMEGTFADAWSGADVSGCLKELSEQLKHQVTGEAVTEEYIKLETEEEEIEYLDEEALKEEAQKEE